MRTPMFAAIDAVINGHVPPMQAVEMLMDRSPKLEGLKR